MSTHELILSGIVLAENILPHLPCKADSTIQLVLNVLKSIFTSSKGL